MGVANSCVNGGIIGPWPYIGGANGIWVLFEKGAINGCGNGVILVYS